MAVAPEPPLETTCGECRIRQSGSAILIIALGPHHPSLFIALLSLPSLIDNLYVLYMLCPLLDALYFVDKTILIVLPHGLSDLIILLLFLKLIVTAKHATLQYCFSCKDK